MLHGQAFPRMRIGHMYREGVALLYLYQDAIIHFEIEWRERVAKLFNVF
jgi:hypothetical protein